MAALSGVETSPFFCLARCACSAVLQALPCCYEHLKRGCLPMLYFLRYSYSILLTSARSAKPGQCMAMMQSSGKLLLGNETARRPVVLTGRRVRGPGKDACPLPGGGPGCAPLLAPGPWRTNLDKGCNDSAGPPARLGLEELGTRVCPAALWVQQNATMCNKPHPYLSTHLLEICFKGECRGAWVKLELGTEGANCARRAGAAADRRH